MDADMMPLTAGAPSEEGDYTQGFEICVRVTPQGYQVLGPEPLEPLVEAGEDTEEPATLPTIREALQAVMVLVRNHPLTDDENAQLEAGYQSKGLA